MVVVWLGVCTYVYILTVAFRLFCHWGVIFPHDSCIYISLSNILKLVEVNICYFPLSILQSSVGEDVSLIYFILF